MKLFLYQTFVWCTLILVGVESYAQTNQTSVSFKVDGACGMCKQRIEKTAKKHGARTAVWDISTHLLTLQLDAPEDLEKIQQAIADAGHDTEKYKAADEVYETLPDCCLYRTSENPDNGSHGINGIILTEDDKGNLKPLQDATIVWIKSGKGTLSDENGYFIIYPEDPDDLLLISYAGYTPDTLKVENMNDIQVILGSNQVLSAVQVTAGMKNLFINKYSPIRTQTITSGELMKAACCNLSESFETNPSVDVTYNDAVSGSKQIQLLGLAGIYTQLTVENMPGPRGLATATGLSYIPGTWIESIQLSKGTGSVVNGFESIAGQINVELKKPQNSEILFANAYVNNQGKVDLNLNLSARAGKNWNTGLLLHNASLHRKMDANKDGFRDQPTGNLFTMLNRWHYQDHHGVEAQIGIKVLSDRKTGGELDFNASDKLQPTLYGVVINNNRYELFGKLGYVFPGKKYKSAGIQFSAFDHDQQAYFGTTLYKGRQSNLYTNLIYQSIIGNSHHIFKTGLNFVHDRYDELFIQTKYIRNENTSGAFFEYAYTPNDKIGLVLGLRGDYNSIYGWSASPRLNFRYEPILGTTIRVSGGRGQRTANIFAENMSVLASSRQVEIHTTDNKGAYGLKQESAWNKGISIDQQIKLFGRRADISFDFFRNDFVNQVIVDIENARRVRFYNLDGKSYSNSFQVEFNALPVQNLEMRLAYRWFDVKTTYGNILLEKPLTSKHRAFLNLGYKITSWRFDYTVHYNGEKRIPSTEINPAQYQFGKRSPDYITMNAQLTRIINKKHGFEVYLGIENITNYIQQKAIIASEDPFSSFFDASLIWGPLQERMFYFGVRFKLKNENE